MKNSPARNPSRSLAKGIAGVIVGATVLGTPLTGGVAAAQAPPTPAVVDIAPFCANVPEGSAPFTDAGSTFADEITCLFAAGITNGTTDTTYSPGVPLRRDQMASLVINTIATAHRLNPALPGMPLVVGTGPFSDTVGNHHEKSIRYLASAQIVEGGPGSLPDHNYGPSLPVTRAQMASMLVRTIDYMTGDQPSTTDDFFSDDDGSTHEDNVNALASLGVALGTGPDSFSPGESVTRGQMSAFLARTLARLQQDGHVDALPFPDAAASGMTSVDNGDGSATLTFTVVDTEGAPLTGLTPEDFTYTALRTAEYSLVSEYTNYFAEVADGVYTVLFESTFDGDILVTDVKVHGVVIEESLEVTVTGTR